MRTLMTELFFGNLNPQNQRIKHGSDYEATEQRIVSLEDKLTKTLDDEQKRTFKLYAENIAEQGEVDLLETFITGFRCGMRLAYEAMDENDGDFTGIP